MGMGGWSVPAVLAIAGSDSSGGAGIQADIKTISAHGLFAETAITALTAQNTCGVRDVMEATPEMVAEQIDAVFEDIPPAAVKVGMVPSAAIAEAIAARLERWGARNVVVDPVMVATSGARLMGDDAASALVARLLPLARVITPNIPEASALLGEPVRNEDEQELAALALAGRLGCAVLVKGGHGVADASDVLVESAVEDEGAPRVTWLRAPRVETANTHGTGCTLSSAIACGLAEGRELPEAVARAKDYLTGALSAGLDLGHGSGPVDHLWRQRAGSRA
ncbi:bifunctional hydroxymethylpyrimidine kinase/phosphomethylpyrimidine kinase [Olsenella sp. An290]|uniref:bifunctional hydroxymethylpyrimidine kinase/phosphomethylpyrimidine kinase n=1 Tax=Olsenella sp. An290 TaxID=1965625 RepID=UPI001EF3F38D|nr:bifunctional hydroxymethylpyrimidine kinase/phosphomethylpyrimidine kinase [Olsenella sp. An290]